MRSLRCSAFGTGADLVCRGRLCLAEHLPEPAGNTCGLRVDIVLIQALFFVFCAFWRLR